MDEPEPTMRMEKDPHGKCVQLHEPTKPCVAEGVLVKYEGWKENPAYNPTMVNVIAMVFGTV